MDYKNLIKRSIISLIFIFIYILISYFNFDYILYAIILIYILIFIEIYLFFVKFRTLILIYLLLSFTSLLNIEISAENFVKFNLMIVSIVSFDTFSYLIGSLIGKNKILSVISPKKTLEGLIGGFIISIIVSLLYLNFYNDNFSLIDIIFIVLIIISSFIGDILESIFKRLNNLKNSSNLLSGHGGFFDRFDSFVFSIIIYFIFEAII